ncbi:tetratricopeptide repeat protein [Thalassotalea ganghwensis]
MIKHPIELTIENFQQVILEQSKQTLVLVAFWAEQVPESIALKDALIEKTASFTDHIVLATVDCAAQQQIAAQFGLQALPTAVVIKDGQPIDGISGPQTEEMINTFLEAHLPKLEDNLLEQAREHLAQGQANEAYTAAIQAHQLAGERADITLVLADVSVELGKLAEAETLLATVKMVDQDSVYHSIVAKLELAQQAADSPEINALEQQLVQTPEDTDLKKKLAVQYSQVNRNEEALALLFSIVSTNGDQGEAKQLLLDVLKQLPEGDPLASQYRRRLFSLMY